MTRRRIKARTKARTAAKVRLAPKVKPAGKRIAKVPPRLLLKPGKQPQKMNRAKLKKALLKERIARARVKLKGKPRSPRGLTVKEKALVREFERKELSPLEAEARRVRL
ncbi:MAG: hypothetical protein AAB325_09005, partial [Pseudomonadota bacterium]